MVEVPGLAVAVGIAEVVVEVVAAGVVVAVEVVGLGAVAAGNTQLKKQNKIKPVTDLRIQPTNLVYSA